MLRSLIILAVCFWALFARRIGRGETWNIDYREEDRQENYNNNDPVVAAEGKVLQKIKSDIYQLEKKEADVEMDIMKRLNHQNQREKHLHHINDDDEDHFLGEGSGRRLYYAM